MIETTGTFVRTVRTSKALWIPVVWLFLAGSRPISGWLNIGAVADTTDRYLEGSPIDRNIFTALIVAAVIVLALRGRKVGELLQANGPILLFLFYCGLSIVWSDFPDVAFKRWVRAVGDMAMILVVLTDPSPLAAVESFLSRTAFAIIPLSILFDLARGFSGRGWHYGVTLNKNMYGVISMVLGLGAVWRFLTLCQRGKREGHMRGVIVHGFIVTMALWCLWSANSATSTACFLLGTMLMLLTSRWSLARKPALLHFIVASLVSLAVYALVLNPDLGIVSAMGKDPTLTGRTDLWPSLIAMTHNPWLGAGFESFWLGPRLTTLWNIFVWRPNEAHNGYLEVYLNLGWTGVILFGVVLVTGYRKIARRVRQDTATNGLWLAYFVVAVIYSLTEAGFRLFSPMWIAFLLSITASFNTQREDTKSYSEIPQPSRHRTFPEPELGLPSRFCGGNIYREAKNMSPGRVRSLRRLVQPTGDHP
jgi:exopolysaccharide production protein ExoQ